MEKCFVFVVCGDEEHIDTLNYSLKYLRHFVKVPIAVVTDSSRNAKDIAHDNVVDIATPVAFNHHQASIYLKTGLHQFLPVGPIYCYLDSDIIALSGEASKIFDYKQGPVTFASDHCKLTEFAPYAVNCGCRERKAVEVEKFEAINRSINPNMGISDPALKAKNKELSQELEMIRRDKWQYAGLVLKYFTSGRIFKLDKQFSYDKRKKQWLDEQGNTILYDVKNYYSRMEQATGFKWDKTERTWVNKNGDHLYTYKLACEHLHQQVKQKFGVEISDKQWMHWNGGVFLFGPDSHEFLDYWHRITLEVFEDTYWRTRDQGTLAASAWKFGLQNQPRLPKEFNFIADYYNQEIRYKPEKGFTDDNFETTLSPKLIHVYHHFGDTNWSLWNGIEALGKEIGIL
ncbi:MAG: hypothetical protein SFW35_06625 [Chitinophagales bacterium]|nr:hypothetical protein [Chitinophagales bacterium]